MGLVRKKDGTEGLAQWPLEMGTPIAVTIAATGVPQQVSVTSVPCFQALVQPKCDSSGVATNSHVVGVGNVTAQLLQIRPDDFGAWLPTSDLASLYVKGTQGEIVIVTPAV